MNIIHALELIQRHAIASGRDQILVCDVEAAINALEQEQADNDALVHEINSMDAGQS